MILFFSRGPEILCPLEIHNQHQHLLSAPTQVQSHVPGPQRQLPQDPSGVHQGKLPGVLLAQPEARAVHLGHDEGLAGDQGDHCTEEQVLRNVVPGRRATQTRTQTNTHVRFFIVGSSAPGVTNLYAITHFRVRLNAFLHPSL